LLQALCERGQAGVSFWVAGVEWREHANAPHPLALLRPRPERPRGCRAAEKRDELPPPHVGHEPSSRLGVTTIRALSLPQPGRSVIEANLNCSESSRRRRRFTADVAVSHPQWLYPKRQ
jgi:hypothetical protein